LAPFLSRRLKKRNNEKMRPQKKERSHQITPFADNLTLPGVLTLSPGCRLLIVRPWLLRYLLF